MKLLALALLATVLLALAGCGVGGNPCKNYGLVGKVVVATNKDDGTEVEAAGKPAICEDGEPVPVR